MVMSKLHFRIGCACAFTYLGAVTGATMQIYGPLGRPVVDLWLTWLTTPFTLIAWFVSGSGRFAIRSGDPAMLALAIAFCALLAYGLGSSLSRGSQKIWLRLH
jgi:hypothetical protein